MKHINDVWNFLDQFHTVDEIEKAFGEIPSKFGGFEITNRETCEKEGFAEICNSFWDAGCYEYDYHTIDLTPATPNMVATKIVRDKERGSWAVQVYHAESGRYYWLDVSYDEKYHEISVDWNQYIFYNTDEDDMARKKFQEDCDNFDAANSEVYWALLNEGEIKETNTDRGGIEIAVVEWKAKSWELKKIIKKI